MKKIIVVGCPGSGKSTFSKKLHRLTSIPLFHLDMMYWKKDQTTVEKEEFLRLLSKVLQMDSWILDGNYASTMEQRLAACDTAIFLDYPAEVCLEGVRSRRGQARSDIPWIETKEDEEFIAFVQSFNEQQKPKILNLFQTYGNKNCIVLHSRAEGEKFLSRLEKTAAKG